MSLKIKKSIDLDIINAFNLIFGENFDPAIPAIYSVNPRQIKTAYRKKAFETHPDRAIVLGKNINEMNNAFKKINIAYEKLCIFYKDNQCHFSDTTSLQGKKKYNKSNSNKKTGAKTKNTFNSTQSANPSNKSSKGFTGHKNKKENPNNNYYNYSMPNIELLFGQFLYYSGIINWRSLINAIIWQRRQRPRFGEIAVHWDILTNDEVTSILKRLSIKDRIGDFALKNGYINSFERMAIVGKQRYMQSCIGEYFLKTGYISSANLQAMIEKQRIHNNNIKKQK